MSVNRGTQLPELPLDSVVHICRDCIYKYWSAVRAMDAAGHQIASHTYSHPDLLTLTQEQVSAQMTLLHPIYQDIIGKVGP